MTVNRKLTLAAVPLLLAVTVGAVALGSRAGAQEAEESPAPALVKVSDQQNVTTDATGRVTLDLRNGEKNQRCLDTERIESFTIQLAGNKSGGRDPLFVQTAQNTECSIKLRFFDINTTPIAGHVVRLGYTADGQVQTFADSQAPPAPEPEPTPTPDPDPEPGPSLLIASGLPGDPALPQGVTPIGEVDAGQYKADVPEGVFCYAALLSANDPVNGVIGDPLINVRGPASPDLTVPTAEENAEVKFLHVDCAAE